MDFQRARTVMVDCQVRPNSVTDFEIIQMMGEVPRENFVPTEQRELAYIDQHLQLPNGRNMLSPMRLSQLLQLADIKPTDVVLDVACNTGYAAAVMSGLASSVVAIDENESFVDAATESLADLDIGNVAVMQADVSQGFAKEAPYDVILIEGSVDSVAPALLKQLAEDGRLVCVEPCEGVHCAVIYTKSGGEVSRREAFDATVPVLSAFSNEKEFRF